MRFYFDVHINEKIYPDPVGRDFARSEDAHDFAVNIARDFIHSTHQNPRKVARAIIEVTNRRDISMAVRTARHLWIVLATAPHSTRSSRLVSETVLVD